MTSLLKTMEKFGAEKLYDIRKVRDEALFFYQESYHFWDLETIFLKSNAFQTIFFITFCYGNNSFTTVI